MNELIRKLAEQSGSTHKQNLGVYQFYTDELEKFAELIVKECAEFARQHNLAKADRSHLIHQTIKEHFGIKV